MKDLRKNEFVDMLEMADILFEDKGTFIHCDIPTLGKITYYPKADKIQINKTNSWEEGGFNIVKNIFSSTTNVLKTSINEVASLVKIKEIKSDDELRDDFAKAAMQGLISNHLVVDDIRSTVPEWLSVRAYLIADAMMKQRKS